MLSNEHYSCHMTGALVVIARRHSVVNVNLVGHVLCSKCVVLYGIEIIGWHTGTNKTSMSIIL